MAEEDKKLEDSLEIEKNSEIEDDQVTASSADDEDDGIPAEEGIEQLKKTLQQQKLAYEEERRLRAEADKRAYEAQLRAQNSDNDALNANYYQIKGAVAQLEERGRGLVAALTEAKQMGDVQRETELQRELMKTDADMRTLLTGKERIESELRRPVQPVPPPQIDPVEAAAATMSPRSAAWTRSHHKFLSDPRNALLARAAHYKSDALGIEQDTDAYFSFIEEELGLRSSRSRKQEEHDDDDDGALSAAAAPSSRRSVAPPAAPVSRGGSRRGTFTLSPEEREIAQITGQTEEQYYKNKMRDKKRA
jgi:hypothetical protein